MALQLIPCASAMSVPESLFVYPAKLLFPIPLSMPCLARHRLARLNPGTAAGHRPCCFVVLLHRVERALAISTLSTPITAIPRIMAKSLVGALALASLPSALAFRNTSPFFLFSTAAYVHPRAA